MPVDGAVVVNGQVPEAHGAAQTPREVRRKHARVSQRVEGGAHGLWHRQVEQGNDVRAHVDVQLDGASQVERDDVLRVEVRGERVGGGRAPSLDPRDGATKGLQLGGDHVPVHRALRVSKMRRR